MSGEAAVPTLPPAADTSAIVQRYKAQLLSGEKALNKNQRKKARKKVTKLVQKTLGVVRTSRDDARACEQPSASEETGCSNRRAGGHATGPPACTSTPQLRERHQGLPPIPLPPTHHQQHPMSIVPTPKPGEAIIRGATGTTAEQPPPKRRRVHPDTSLPGCKRGENGIAAEAWPAAKRAALRSATARVHAATAATGGAAAERVLAAGQRGLAGSHSAGGLASSGPGQSGGSSHLSRGAQKRLSRRRAQPEDLLNADDDTERVLLGGSEAGAGAGAEGGAGAPGSQPKHEGDGVRQSRRQRPRERRQDRRRGGGAWAGSSLGPEASEEVVQIPRTTGPPAFAATAAVVAVMHRGYTMYGSSFAGATVAAPTPLLPAAAAVAAAPPLPGAAVRSGHVGAGGAHGALQSPADMSAALLLMRVQLRASAGAGAEGLVSGLTADTADTAAGSEGAAGAAVTSEHGPRDGDGVMAMDAGVTMGACALAPATAAAGPGHEVGPLGRGDQQQRHPQQPDGKPQRGHQAADKAGLHRYGNYHRYYGYRLGQDLDEDPRVKLMRREWFQGRVCIDVGCNEGLVTLAVAARFGAKRMTGYDIDAALIKRACCNLRVMRTEFTTRLQTLTLGGTHAGGAADSTWTGDGGAGGSGEMDVDAAAGPPRSGSAAPQSTVKRSADSADGGEGAGGSRDGDCGPAAAEQEAVRADGGRDGGGSGSDADDGTGKAGGSSADEEEEGDGDEGLPAAQGVPQPDAAAGDVTAGGRKAAGKKEAHRARGPYRASGPPPPPRVGLLRSHVRSLAGTFFVVQDWANARGRPESVDTIMCLSVTKWVHLNHGDEGLKKLFKKFYDSLTPGGLLLLEPQPWKSYKRAVHKTTTHDVPFRHIEQLQLRPQHFVDYLTDQLGFVLEVRLNEGGGVGFDRPMYLFRKP